MIVIYIPPMPQLTISPSPYLYKARFINAMERYFMTIPNKWTQMDNNFFTKKNHQ